MYCKNNTKIENKFFKSLLTIVILKKTTNIITINNKIIFWKNK